MRNFILASGLALAAASTANAGGYSAPVVDAVPVVAPVVVTETPAWQGAYVGAALGYAFNGDDRIGTNDGATRGTLGTAELSGGNFGVQAGYRWQRNNWVFGPELSYTTGSIEDDFEYGAGPTEFKSEVNNTIGLTVKAGYLVRPDTLVYGLAGYKKGDFTYTNGGTEIDYDADGYVVGVGAERMISDRMSLFAEYEYSNFGRTEVDLGGGVTTEATPEFSNVKMGLNFKF